MRTTTLLSAAIAGLFFPVSAFAFSDVKSTSPYYEAVTYVQEKGVVKGYNDGTFRPNQTVNRAEFTKIMIGASGKNVQSNGTSAQGKIPFSDVKMSDWFGPYIFTAYNDGIIAGYSDGTFRPASQINFAESTKIIANAFGLTKVQDDSEVWYKGYVDALAAKNAIPVSVPSFNANLTRGDMAEIVFRLMSGNNDKASKTYEDFTGQKQPVAKECTLPATTDESGMARFPTSTAYAQLKELGPIFTASDCGGIRLSEVAGGLNASYTAGSVLWVTNTPDQEFQDVLKSIGYVCSEDEGCYKWELHKTVTVKDLLKLKPYVLKIRMDSCINCE